MKKIPFKVSREDPGLPIRPLPQEASRSISYAVWASEHCFILHDSEEIVGAIGYELAESVEEVLFGAALELAKGCQPLPRGRLLYITHVGSTVRGLGSMMVELAIKEARRFGLPMLLASLPESVGFWEKLRFVKIPGMVCNLFWLQPKPPSFRAKRVPNKTKD